MNKKELSLYASLMEELVESWLIYGELSVADFTDDKKLFKKIINLIKKDEGNDEVIPNYHLSLMEQGQMFAKNNEFDYAYIFYSTYFEHFINEIIHIWGLRNKIQKKDLNAVIRLNLEPKYTWVLSLIKLPPFSKKHFELIKTISEKRNSFVHYKYHSKKISDFLGEDKKKWEDDFKKISKTITYSRKYRSKIIFSGMKFNTNIWRINPKTAKSLEK